MAALDILRLLLSVLATFKSRESSIAAFFRYLVPHGRDVAGGYGIVIIPGGGRCSSVLVNWRLPRSSISTGAALQQRSFDHGVDGAYLDDRFLSYRSPRSSSRRRYSSSRLPPLLLSAYMTRAVHKDTDLSPRSRSSYLSPPDLRSSRLS